VVTYFNYIINFLQQTSALLGALVLFVLSANAQTQTPADTLKTQHLNDAIVTGQYGENSLKNSVFKELVNIELETPIIAPHRDQNIKNGMNGLFKHKIALINQIDDKIYKRLKKDLNLQ
jgi:LytS/YehU family sensor histidine kinase